VHVWLIQRWAKDWRTVVSSVGRIVARLAIVDSKPALTKIFMHFSTTSTALFGRIRLLDCAGPGDGRRVGVDLTPPMAARKILMVF
jgi:hypothetical protein